ncbi:unnamed protein product [Caenorhabditis nigoni]
MIRRVRVALKHASPIYASEKSNLMPSLLGAPNNNRHRLVYLLLCFAFLYFWNRREHTYSEESRRKDEQLELVQREHASVLEKLRVIWLHKKKIESDSIAHKTELEKFNSKIKLKESEIYGYRTKNEQCKRELQSCHKDDGAKKLEEPPKSDASEVSGLKLKIEEMQKKLEEQETNSNSMAAILKEELKQCETKIHQLTGVR